MNVIIFLLTFCTAVFPSSPSNIINNTTNICWGEMVENSLKTHKSFPVFASAGGQTSVVHHNGTLHVIKLFGNIFIQQMYM